MDLATFGTGRETHVRSGAQADQTRTQPRWRPGRDRRQPQADLRLKGLAGARAQLRLPVLLLAGALLLGGCGGATTPSSADGIGAATPSGSAGTSSSSSPAPKSGGSGISRYVALGDSYTAAPYVYLTDVAKGCLRSNGNYPTLLAKKLGVGTLVDVSCSAAETADLTHPQKTFQGSVPAQLDAVGPGTDLVTIGLGGNDYGLFASLSSGCPITGPNGRQVRPSKAGRCGVVDRPTALRDVAGVRARLTNALREVHAKAPDATVVLVGYPRIASTTHSCPAALPVSRSAADTVDGVTRDLRNAMRTAARTTHSRFVDMYAASRGHDVCAGKAAWVNGVKTDTERAAPLHPFAVEQRAVADRVAALLG